MYRSLRWALLAVAIGVVAPTAANAQAITYRFADTSDVFSNSFTIGGVGQTVSIRLYVEQTSGNPLGSDGGLVGLAMRLRFDNPIGSGAPSLFANVVDRGVPPATFGQDVTPNVPPGGFSTINGGTPTSVVINNASSFAAGIQPDANGRIFIGSIRFTGLAEGTTPIRAEDPNNPGQPGGDFTTFTNFIGLDSLLVAGNASITVAVVPTVPVGNVGNANDPATGGLYGGVGYAYNINKTEVTVGQYTEFLNAVADTDTYALYNTSMATDLNIAGISRDGVSGSYSYSVIGSADKPVTYVSWGDAARYSNWLHNDQPTGLQGPTTTERGAYTLDGAVTNEALNGISRNANAQSFIPTESEWYKAAYHKNDGATGNYWDFATSTDAVPSSDQPSGSGAPTESNTANFFKDDGSANGYDDGYAVSGSNSFVNSQNYLTDVGAYSLSASPYGTFDQGGNVYEWNEALISGSSRGIRGGSWSNGAGFLPASDLNNGADPANEFKTVGFRVASIPGLPGDYNQNGTVDAADYTVWRNNLGSGTSLPNDDTAGVGQDDYIRWKSNFGQTSGAGSRAFENAAVPEPATLVLLMLAAIGWCVRRSRAA